MIPPVVLIWFAAAAQSIVLTPNAVRNWDIVRHAWANHRRAVIAIGILVIVIEINIARLIVTLSPLQIAMFLVAQLVGVSIGLLLIGIMFPLSPADLEAIAASSPPA